MRFITEPVSISLRISVASALPEKKVCGATSVIGRAMVFCPEGLAALMPSINWIERVTPVGLVI